MLSKYRVSLKSMMLLSHQMIEARLLWMKSRNIWVMSDYSHTKDSVTDILHIILHIINMENPMPSDELNSNQVNNAFTQLTSKICLTYAQSVLSSCPCSNKKGQKMVVLAEDGILGEKCV